MTDRPPGEADSQAGKHPDRQAGTVGKAGKAGMRSRRQAKRDHGIVRGDKDTRDGLTDERDGRNTDSTTTTDRRRQRATETDRDTIDRPEQTEKETHRQTDGDRDNGMTRHDRTWHDIRSGSQPAANDPARQAARPTRRQACMKSRRDTANQTI